MHIFCRSFSQLWFDRGAPVLDMVLEIRKCWGWKYNLKQSVAAYLSEPAGNSASIVLYGLGFLFAVVSHSLVLSPHSLPLFPTTCSVSDIQFIPSGRRTTSVVPQTLVMLPARLPCCTSGSCESQCCSLFQGKCQTQEIVFKYLHFQIFFFLLQPLRQSHTDQFAALQCNNRK